jgi:fructose-1-phosphate kinase PfkB-like protein
MKSIVTLTMNPTVDLSTRVDQVLAEHKLPSLSDWEQQKGARRGPWQAT